jgi:hypothetical protein
VRKLVLAGAFVSLGVIIAGCGGSQTPGVANVGTTTPNGTTTPGVTAGGTNSGVVAGSSGGEPSGSGGSGKTGIGFSVAGTVPEMTKFAACMRAKGEPSFPDPNAQGVISAGSFDRGSPQFERALDACRKNMPSGTPSPAQQAQELRQAVAMSACMRRNGVPNFPDPESGQGGQVIRISPSSGIDPSAPQFQRAQATCQKQTHGGKG